MSQRSSGESGLNVSKPLIDLVGPLGPGDVVGPGLGTTSPDCARSVGTCGSSSLEGAVTPAGGCWSGRCVNWGPTGNLRWRGGGGSYMCGSQSLGSTAGTQVPSKIREMVFGKGVFGGGGVPGGDGGPGLPGGDREGSRVWQRCCRIRGTMQGWKTSVNTVWHHTHSTSRLWVRWGGLSATGAGRDEERVESPHIRVVRGKEM